IQPKEQTTSTTPSILLLSNPHLHTALIVLSIFLAPFLAVRSMPAPYPPVSFSPPVAASVATPVAAPVSVSTPTSTPIQEVMTVCEPLAAGGVDLGSGYSLMVRFWVCLLAFWLMFVTT